MNDERERSINIMATIATHNGSQVAQGHNRRDRNITDHEAHIDANGHFEIWKDEDVKEAYNTLFGASVRAFNERERHKARRIPDDDYYTFLAQKVADEKAKHTTKSKTKKPVYEMIVGVYDKNISDDTKKAILREFYEGWEQKNPNLYLLGAYYHADEPGADIHLHIDYIPFADCDKGMSIQNSLSKALEQQGFRTEKGKGTAQMQWQASENQRLEELCNQYGIEVEHPQAGKKVAHRHTKQYKYDKHLEQQIAHKENKDRELDAIISAETQQLNTLKKDIGKKEKYLKEQDVWVDAYEEFFDKYDLWDDFENFMDEREESLMSI